MFWFLVPRVEVPRAEIFNLRGVMLGGGAQ